MNDKASELTVGARQSSIVSNVCYKKNNNILQNQNKLRIFIKIKTKQACATNMYVVNELIGSLTAEHKAL